MNLQRSGASAVRILFISLTMQCFVMLRSSSCTRFLGTVCFACCATGSTGRAVWHVGRVTGAEEWMVGTSRRVGVSSADAACAAPCAAAARTA